MSDKVTRHPSDDLLVSLIGGELDPAREARVREHLRGCETCRRTAREMEEVDGLLRRMPPVGIPSGFGERIGARLLILATGSRSWRHLAAAAMLLAAGMAAGWTIALVTAPASGAVIVRGADGPKFALIFAEDPATLDVPAAEERRRYDEFIAWMHSIGDSRARLGGTELDARDGRIVGASARAMEPGLVLSGFIVVRASSYDEVQRHAERCPIVSRGGQVIVRQLR